MTCDAQVTAPSSAAIAHAPAMRARTPPARIFAVDSAIGLSRSGRKRRFMGTSHGLKRYKTNRTGQADLTTQTLAPFGVKWQMRKSTDRETRGSWTIQRLAWTTTFYDTDVSSS